VPDPYREVKERFNRLALALYSDLAKKVKNSPHPLDMAIRLAIAGNIIDFGIHTRLQMSQVHQSIRDALEAPLEPTAFKLFSQAEKRLTRPLPGDNAERSFSIGFDRNPSGRRSLCSQRAYHQRCLKEDAEFAGLADLVPIIDNGLMLRELFELCLQL
jgi:hypothetical protein